MNWKLAGKVSDLLAQHLQVAQLELGQLVQERYPTMRQRDLARTPLDPLSTRPLFEWVRVTSSASLSERPGAMAGTEWSKSVLPGPGGPTIIVSWTKTECS